MLPRLALSFVNALALLGVVAANLATKEMRGVYCPEGGQPSCCSKIINKDSYEGQVLARRYGVRLPFDEFIGSSCKCALLEELESIDRIWALIISGSPLLYTRSGVKWCPSGTLVSCCSGPYYVSSLLWGEVECFASLVSDTGSTGWRSSNAWLLLLRFRLQVGECVYENRVCRAGWEWRINSDWLWLNLYQAKPAKSCSQSTYPKERLKASEIEVLSQWSSRSPIIRFGICCKPLPVSRMRQIFHDLSCILVITQPGIYLPYMVFLIAVL